MTDDGILNRRGRAVVQERAAQPETPQRRRPELLRSGGLLPNTVAGLNVVQEQIREERYCLSVEDRVRARTRLQRGNVARGASNGTEHRLARAYRLVNHATARRRQKSQEVLEIGDAAGPSSRVPA